LIQIKCPWILEPEGEVNLKSLPLQLSRMKQTQ
jgi:hypothetical protein